MIVRDWWYMNDMIYNIIYKSSSEKFWIHGFRMLSPGPLSALQRGSESVLADSRDQSLERGRASDRCGNVPRRMPHVSAQYWNQNQKFQK